jgi:hypothetical protein
VMDRRLIERELAVGRTINFETPEGTTVRVGREDVFRREFAKEALGKVPPPDAFCEDSGGSFVIGTTAMAKYTTWLREEAGE